ncbi:MAG: TetR/AcrR family transcriptional regulator [Pseudomonas sp.]|nr:TetR/AcrR family transcriptional regulator [Pseudomonas sp.]
MRYSAEHKAQTRERLVKAAGALAKRQGFGTTGVDGLMGAAGLKGSSFYHHFASKGELLKDIIEQEFEGSRLLLIGRQDSSRTQLIKQTKAYLSQEHLDNAEQGCVLPRLSCEVARADEPVRQAFEAGVSTMHADMAKVVGDPAAWAVMALEVGAIMLAAGMASAQGQQQVLQACRQFAVRTIEANSANA